jgi:hypothetical protein
MGAAIKIIPTAEKGTDRIVDRDIVQAPLQYTTIRKGDVIKCRDSLKHIFNESPSENGFSFFVVFWAMLKTMDPNGEIADKLQPHSKSSCPSKNGVILRVLNFITSVPSDKPAVKKKIRSLGRSHARLGIVESHQRIFGDCLIKSFAVCLNFKCTSDLLNIWTNLILFVIQQMCFENVRFLPRMHEVVADERNRDFSVLRGSDASSVTTPDSSNVANIDAFTIMSPEDGSC